MDILFTEVRVLSYQPFQLLPCGNYLYICVRQDFASALQMITARLRVPLMPQQTLHFLRLQIEHHANLLSERPSYIMTVCCYGFGLRCSYSGLIPSLRMSKCFKLSSDLNLALFRSCNHVYCLVVHKVIRLTLMFIQGGRKAQDSCVHHVGFFSPLTLQPNSSLSRLIFEIYRAHIIRPPPTHTYT